MSCCGFRAVKTRTTTAAMTLASTVLLACALAGAVSAQEQSRESMAVSTPSSCTNSGAVTPLATARQDPESWIDSMGANNLRLNS